MNLLKRVVLLGVAVLLVAGANTYTPSFAQDDVDCINTYVIRDGDTLSQIAQNNNVEQAELAALNGIDDPRVIFIGDTLCLDGLVVAQPAPGNGGEAPESGETPDNGATPPPAQPQPVVVPAELEVQANAEIMIRDVEYTTDENGIYIVRGFDRLYNLSYVFGVELTELAAVNNISDRSVIFAGQQLIIPAPSFSAPVPGTAGAVSLVPRVAGPGDIVTVRGANFAPDTDVTVYAEKFSSADQSEALAEVTTDEEGRFEVEIEIPETWEDDRPIDFRTVSIVARVDDRPTIAFGANFYLNLVWLDANNQ